MSKIYTKQTLKGWLHWFLDVWDYHLTMRLAWNPSLLLEQYRHIYKDKWDEKYLELLSMLKSIGDNGKSPFVFYINEKKDKSNLDSNK